MNSGLVGKAAKAGLLKHGNAISRPVLERPERAAQLRCRSTEVAEAPPTVPADEIDAEPRIKLTGDDLEQWDACVSRVTELGFTESEAEKIVEKSFGWKGQGYWRGKKVQEVPTVEQVSNVLNYLQTLGLKEADLAKYVKGFPQVFGCDVDALLVPNVEYLNNTWRLKGSVLTGALKRQPPILGYNVDCEGSCIGECNRCWVRF